MNPAESAHKLALERLKQKARALCKDEKVGQDGSLESFKQRVHAETERATQALDGFKHGVASGQDGSDLDSADEGEPPMPAPIAKGKPAARR